MKVTSEDIRNLDEVIEARDRMNDYAELVRNIADIMKELDDKPVAKHEEKNRT